MRSTEVDAVTTWVQKLKGQAMPGHSSSLWVSKSRGWSLADYILHSPKGMRHLYCHGTCAHMKKRMRHIGETLITYRIRLNLTEISDSVSPDKYHSQVLPRSLAVDYLC